jgi:hypothetical protein
MLHDHEEVVPECEGCKKISYSIVLKQNICSCYVFPRTQWWFGTCDQATHFPSKKPTEDPIKEP